MIIALLLFLGVGTAYTGLLISDQMFTSLLYAGLACGALAVRNESWGYTLLQVVLLGAAAQIRPTLGLFFPAVFFLLLYSSQLYRDKISGRVKAIVVFSVAVMAITGNAPAFRNYIHHGTFTPTSILSDNLARYLAGPVLIAKDRGAEYEKELKTFKEARGVTKIRIQREFAVSVVREYPIETAKRMTYHVVWNLFEPHWEYVLNVFGQGFYLNNIFTTEGKVNFGILKNLPFWLIYILAYLLVFLALLRAVVRGDWMLLGGLVIFSLPLCASLLNGQGARMRLYAEPLIIDLAVIEICRRLYYLPKGPGTRFPKLGLH
ncbi:hypothetical protein [Desulfopila sp. IMCC35008]|uniref:hypothetical protein n=1 Tax=Desulfopila sp. IMCC35008 TaxID=2653858 RepID=UPI0013D54E16|nr:hypothetical protein [Desulfopila sp. IMCC35008]